MSTVYDLSARAKFLLTGQDRVRYLNGQITQDVKLASSSSALYGCVTDAKGHCLADLYFHAVPEGILLDAEASQRESLAQRLERYMIADDVELHDVTDDYALYHELPGSAGILPVQEANEKDRRDAGAPISPHTLTSLRLGQPGRDHWVKRGEPAPFTQAVCGGEAEFEQHRILAGVPRMPQELHAGVFPPEAGLEQVAISYSKGCYIGQEVISRIRSSGKMPQRLVQLRSSTKLEPGMKLSLEAEPERSVGSVTSVAQSPSGVWEALAYVKQGLASMDSVLLARAELSSLPASATISAIVKR